VKSLGTDMEVQVNFGNDTAVVEFDPGKVSLLPDEDEIHGAGYEVIHQEIIIRVGGMMCATCVETIEKALSSLPGHPGTGESCDREGVSTYNPPFLQ